VDVLTYHYDNQRTGQNLNETALTPANVNSTKFGMLGEFPWMAGWMPSRSYLSQVSIGGHKEECSLRRRPTRSVYAFDADSVRGATASFLWKTSTRRQRRNYERSSGRMYPGLAGNWHHPRRR